MYRCIRYHPPMSGTDLDDRDLVTLRLTVNGRPEHLRIPTDRLLVDVLRDDLRLTGTKETCGVGVCGICSVLVDGTLQSACLTLAVATDGAAITTVEGLADGDELTPLQQAFGRHGGFQCGICTPGQLVAATALLAEHPDPDEATVREWMTGNLCRCTGYYGIVSAILATASGDPAAMPPLELRPALVEHPVIPQAHGGAHEQEHEHGHGHGHGEANGGAHGPHGAGRG